MRNNSDSLTLTRKYLSKYRFMIKEYEQVKAKQHPRFRFLEEFY